MKKLWQVVSASGNDMGRYYADSAEVALDWMAKSLGFRDSAHFLKTLKAEKFEGRVYEVKR